MFQGGSPKKKELLLLIGESSSVVVCWGSKKGEVVVVVERVLSRMMAVQSTLELRNSVWIDRLYVIEIKRNVSRRHSCWMCPFNSSKEQVNR